MDFHIDQKKIITDMNFTWKRATRFWNKMLRTIVNKSPRNGSQLRDKKWKERRKIDWSKNIVMVAPHSDNGCHWLACSYSFPQTQGRKLRIWISLSLSLSHISLCLWKRHKYLCFQYSCGGFWTTSFGNKVCFISWSSSPEIHGPWHYSDKILL